MMWRGEDEKGIKENTVQGAGFLSTQTLNPECSGSGLSHSSVLYTP